jgi:hypothetical protein
MIEPLPFCQTNRRCPAAKEVPMRKLMLALSAALLFLLSQRAYAAEKEIAPSKLPHLVTKILEVKYPALELVSAVKDTEDSETVFSVVLKFKDHEYEVLITAKGEILETAKTLAAKDLPEAVAQALQVKYPNAKLKEAFEVRDPTQQPAETFHITLDTAQQKTVQVIVGAGGEILDEDLQKDKE